MSYFKVGSLVTLNEAGKEAYRYRSVEFKQLIERDAVQLMIIAAPFCRGVYTCIELNTTITIYPFFNEIQSLEVPKC